jgi:hypothetical protein
MRRRHRFGILLAGTVLVFSPLLVQPFSAQTAAAKAADNRPIPRLADGHVSFESPAGEKGVWNRQDYHALLPETPDEVALRDRGGNPDPPTPPGLKRKVSEVPFQPWAKSLWMYRQTHEFEPYTRCKPDSGFRNKATPYGTDYDKVP